MSKIKWWNGVPSFRVEELDWSNNAAVATYVGELEATVRAQSDTLVKLAAILKYAVPDDTEVAKEDPKHPYKAEVMSLLNRLAVEYGFNSVDDGEEQITVMNVAEAADCILSVDESRLYVNDRTTGKQEVLFIVLGNESGTLVCDYSSCSKLDVITQAHYEEWEGK